MNSKVKNQIIGLILREWYTIDSVLFNGHARNVIAGQRDFNEYIALKGALLENLYQYYIHVDLRSSRKLPVKEQVLQEMATSDARKAKATAAKLMNDPSSKQKIKSRLIREMRSRKIKNVNAFTDKFVQERFLQYSLDNALVGIPLLEAKNLDPQCKTFTCKLLEEAHKTYRDQLVALALSCKKIKRV